jgi:hypothetical protein
VSAATGSVWPACTAMGVALALFGVIGGPAFVAVGLTFLAGGVAGWVVQIRAEVAADGGETAEGHDGE